MCSDKLYNVLVGKKITHLTKKNCFYGVFIAFVFEFVKVFILIKNNDYFFKQKVLNN